MKLFTRLIVCIGVVSLFVTSSSGASRANFGESCNKSERCDSRNFLSCSSSSVCECLMPDSMVYDETAGKCVTLAGERCVFTTGEGESNLLIQLPCISNGTCNDGVCECVSSHFELANGTCTEKRGFGGMCTSDMMCDSTQSLTCGPEKTCVCDASKGVILLGGECRLLAGKTCSISSQKPSCILGAFCNRTTSTCECDSDRFISSDATCISKRRNGDSCSTNNECLETSLLICDGGKCVCDPTFSIDDSSGSYLPCRKKLGHKCTHNDCMKGANCIQGKCQCVASTHFETENQTCEQRRSNGENCTTDGQCNSSLQCGLSGKCGCANGKVFNFFSKTCVTGANRDCSRYAYCVPFAQCTAMHLMHMNFICLCDSGFESSSNRDGLCYAMQGSECNGEYLGPFTSRQCLPGLVCGDGVCNCPYEDHQIYDSTSKSCKSLIEGPCKVTSDCSDAGAECSAEDELYQCKCREGYTQVGRECRVSYGGKCDVSKNSGSETCDKIAGLKCTNKGICECPALQEYNTEEMSCKGLIGAKCSVQGDMKKPYCGPASFCKPFPRSDDGFGVCTCSHEYKAGSDRRCTLRKVPPTTTTQTPQTVMHV